MQERWLSVEEIAVHLGVNRDTLYKWITRKRMPARKLASKIYTDELNLPPEELIRRHRHEIVAHFYPGAVISHRSALEGNVSPGGKLHVTVPRAVAPVRELPGLEIRIWRGPAPQAEDARTPLGDGKEIFTPGQARAVLENLQIARAHGNDEPKTLSAAELEQWLDRYLRIFGADWLNTLRQQVAALQMSRTCPPRSVGWCGKHFKGARPTRC